MAPRYEYNNLVYRVELASLLAERQRMVVPHRYNERVSKP